MVKRFLVHLGLPRCLGSPASGIYHLTRQTRVGPGLVQFWPNSLPSRLWLVAPPKLGRGKFFLSGAKCIPRVGHVVTTLQSDPQSLISVPFQVQDRRAASTDPA